MYDPQYNIKTIINIFVNIGIEILLNIIIFLLPIFIIPTIENFISHLFQTKKRKENVYKDVLKIICIYILYPFLLIIILPTEFLGVGLIIMNRSEKLYNFTNFFLSICTLFCTLYISLYCLSKSKIINLYNKICENKTVFIISILLLLYRIFIYFIWEILVYAPEEKITVLYSYLYILFFPCCLGIIPVPIYYIYCFFIKKTVVVRKKLINYTTTEDKKKIWEIIRIPILLELCEIEYIIFSFGFFSENPYLFISIHIFWLLLELLSINIVIFYIYRPTYTIQSYIFYNITLKSGKQFGRIPSYNLTKKKEIIEVKIENDSYYFNEKDVKIICEEKEYKFSFLDKKKYKIKCIFLWIIEICIGLLIIIVKFIEETT